MNERTIRWQAALLLGLMGIAALVGKQAWWLFVLLSAGIALTGIILARSVMRQVNRKVSDAEKNHR